jgi:hypothetical protein
MQRSSCYQSWEKNPTDVTSCRPISLLPVISKILEKLLLKRIYNDTHFQAWIPLHQFSFRKAHSTIQQFHRLTDIINKALDDQQYCSAVFLDVSQAFDKVWHQGLLLKIKQTLHPVYFNLLKLYLQNRYFVTTYNKETSPPISNALGCPPRKHVGSVIIYDINSRFPTIRRNNPQYLCGRHGHLHNSSRSYLSLC